MKNTKLLMTMVICSVMFSGCDNHNRGNKGEAQKNPPVSGFANDVAFLREWDRDLIVLTAAQSDAQVIVSPKYQGKVFTSTAEGKDGRSFGWINYKAFGKQIDPHMNAYGGEDRLWLGPEGGSFSLFFAPGREMIFDQWHTPAAIDTQPWNLVSSSQKAVRMTKDMELLNYAGTVLKLNINRQVEILEPGEIEKMLSITLDSQIKAVGFKTINALRNTGDIAWNKETGAPCLWSLDMFTPSPKTVIVIPYDEAATGKVATTDYFGEIPADRIVREKGLLYFKADGLSRGKLGIPPQRTKPVAGSYAADTGVLTITLFDVDKTATYLNQEWTTKKDPFVGDAMNAYNDGPLADGTQMGPFYEIESVSPGAFIAPDGLIEHKHSVFHFVGDIAGLDAIAQRVLGTSLERISSIFDKPKQ
ncbi:DUF6786 family protein [Sphingobacterium thalpophilum]|uniref:DUF6786 family protein n=1 Tax=Sphingobacterium thalpophilum TaxID=259 RepID=A0ABV4HC05_9SPHI|nr:DUF6786 family protein [Sphingobacterium thalpophilum]